MSGLLVPLKKVLGHGNNVALQNSTNSKYMIRITSLRDMAEAASPKTMKDLIIKNKHLGSHPDTIAQIHPGLK